MTVDLDEVVARCVAGELPPTTGLLIDALIDPDEWSEDVFDTLDTLCTVPRETRSERGLLKLEHPTVIAGDLIVDGDLECLSHTLVIGSVRCTGYVYSGIHDCLVIAGDLEARSLEALRSYWLIGGSIAAETIWLSTYGSLHQRGEVRARLLLLQMYFELQNDTGIHAGTRIETDYLPKDDAARARLREVLDVETLLDEDGALNSWTLLRNVARGKPVFRRHDP